MFRYLRTPIFLLFLPLLSYLTHALGLININNFSSDYVLYSRITSMNYIFSILLLVVIALSTKCLDKATLVMKGVVIILVFTSFYFISFKASTIANAPTTLTPLFWFDFIQILSIILMFFLEKNK